MGRQVRAGSHGKWCLEPEMWTEPSLATVTTSTLHGEQEVRILHIASLHRLFLLARRFFPASSLSFLYLSIKDDPDWTCSLHFVDKLEV